MTFPISVNDAIVILPGLEVSTIDKSVNSTNLTDIINAESNKIVTKAKLRGLKYQSVTAHQTDLLSLFSQFGIWENIVNKRAGNCDPAGFIEFLDFISLIKDTFADGFEFGLFDESWLTLNNIPHIQLATETEAASATPSWNMTADSKPNTSQVQNFTYQFSATIYSVAKVKGYKTPSDLTTLPTTLRSVYKEMCVYSAGALALAIHSLQFPDLAKGALKIAKKFWLQFDTDFNKLQNDEFFDISR